MAHFAQLDGNNLVTTVIVVANSDSGGGDLDTEATGVAFCQNHINDNTSVWKQTSYNENFRGNYAGIGMTYMTGVRTLGVASTDIFISQRPYYASWPIGIMTARYVPPGPPGGPPDLSESERAEGKCYEWDENQYRLAIDHGLDLSIAWVLK